MRRYIGLLSIAVMMFSFICAAKAQSETTWTVDKNTIGLWKMDEGSGSVVADATGKNPGQITDCVWMDGKSGKALKFNGESSHVNCGTGDSDQLTSAITVEARFRLSDLNFDNHAWCNIVNKQGPGNRGYYLMFYLGHLACGLGTGSGWYNIEIGQPGYVSQVYDTGWHTAKMIYDGKNLSLWYDDNLVGRRSADGSILPGDFNLWIGGYESTPTGRGFRGDIDEVRISNIARQDATAGAAGKNTVLIKGAGAGKCSIEETDETIILRNDLVEYVFDKMKGGVLSNITDTKNPSVIFHVPGQSLVGEWGISIVDSASVSSASSRYQRGEYTSEKGQCMLKLFSNTQGGELEQIYSLKDTERSLKCQAVYCNKKQADVMVGAFGYTLSNLAIGGSLDGNRYIYPPTWLHYMRGDVKGATQGLMSAQYIYGSLQPTDKMQLPYSMIYNDSRGESMTIAAVNSRTKAYVGALGGDSGLLRTAFDLYKFVKPGERLELGTAYLSLWNKDWQSSMVAEKELLMQAARYSAPKRRPDFVNNLVIVWDGFPGYGFDTFDGLSKVLPVYKELGINAMIIGGRTWSCYFDRDPSSGVEGFIPMPQNGQIVPSATTGGEAGLERLVAKAHSLGMKIFAWGPTSLAGIDNHSDELTSHPDWWIYGKDGQLSRWYRFMLPPDSDSKGWQDFYTANVSRVIGKYGLDGFWLDSSWQDHGLNYKAADGWYGGPNGAKIGLVEKIVDTAKKANPDCVVMSESSGAELMSRVDINYLQVRGIWPAIKPEELQTFIKMEELNRIPGMRPFGHIELGVGFYADLGDETNRELAKKYKDSWIAKTFLVSTLDRVPVYFGLNWGIGVLANEDKDVTLAPGLESNPERLQAEADKELFKKWASGLKTINRVRTENIEIRRGETVFGCINASSPSIVNFVRSLSDKKSIVLLNADNTAQTVNIKVLDMKALELAPDGKYKISNLMTDKLIENGSGNVVWKGSELSSKGIELALDGYQGAVLKILPAGR